MLSLPTFAWASYPPTAGQLMRLMVQSAQSLYDAERLHEMAERLGQEQDFKSYDDDIDLDAVDAAYAAGGRGWAYSE